MEFVCSEVESEFVVVVLVFEVVDVVEGLSYGDVEEEMWEGEEDDWCLVVVVVEMVWGLWEGEEDEGEEDEEELE